MVNINDMKYDEVLARLIQYKGSPIALSGGKYYVVYKHNGLITLKPIEEAGVISNLDIITFIERYQMLVSPSVIHVDKAGWVAVPQVNGGGDASHSKFYGETVGASVLRAALSCVYKKTALSALEV